MRGILKPKKMIIPAVSGAMMKLKIEFACRISKIMTATSTNRPVEMPMMRYFLDRGGKINFNSEIENLKFSDYKVKGIQQRLDRIYVYRYDGVIHILQNIPAEKSFFSREIPVNEIPEESYTKVELKQYRALFIGFFDDELIII